MAQCSQCKAETQLHLNGVPICPGCDDARSKKVTLRPTEGPLILTMPSANHSPSPKEPEASVRER
jgi:hypothetical protein